MELLVSAILFAVLVAGNIYVATVAAECGGTAAQDGVFIGYALSIMLVAFGVKLGALFQRHPTQQSREFTVTSWCAVVVLFLNISVATEAGACTSYPVSGVFVGFTLSLGQFFLAFEIGKRDEIRRQERRQERLRELEAAEEPLEIKVAAAA